MEKLKTHKLPLCVFEYIIKNMPNVACKKCGGEFYSKPSWVKKGKKPTPKISLELPPLDLSEIKLVWQHNNLADIWNAENHSPKYIPREYLKN